MRISDWSSDVCSSDLQLDRRYLGIVEYGIGLCQHPLPIEHAEIAHVHRVLHGQRGNDRSGMTALGEQGFDICLQTGATTGVVAGETEDNGARAVDINGARAYNQTPRSGAQLWLGDKFTRNRLGLAPGFYFNLR